MKTKLVWAAMVTVLLLQAQAVFAADTNRDFDAAIKESNFSKAERILKNNTNKWSTKEQGACWVNIVLYNNSTALRTAQLLYKYKVSFDNATVGIFINGKDTEELCRYLLSIRMPIGDNAITWAISQGFTDNFVQLLLEKGGTLNNRALQAAAKNKRWTLFPDLINKSTEDDINYRWTRDEYTAWYNSQSAAYKQYISFNYDPSESRTALMFAAQYGQLRIVRLLVEHGARVNLRAEGGETAASLAYDNGEIDIYDYLKANGARDFEPRQVVQQTSAPAQSSSTTNVYVQPSAPAQQAPAQPERNVGREIAEAFRSPLQNGTYSLVGTKDTLRLSTIAKSGVFTYNVQGQTGTGTYSIDGNRMTIQMKGYTLSYSVNSETSFSGGGETWVRTGY